MPQSRLERPLARERGTRHGQDADLAKEVAAALGLRMIEWHIKSTTRSANHGLYEYDAVSRLRDAAGRRPGARHSNYIRTGNALGSVRLRRTAVLLIDEIDKADIEFPNDLLQELDRMEFLRLRDRETIRRKPPVVIITSQQ